MLGPCASPLDKFEAMQMCFASGFAEKKSVFEELVDENVRLDFLLSTERCPITARPDSTVGNETASSPVAPAISKYLESCRSHFTKTVTG